MRPTNQALDEKHRLHAEGLRRCFSCSQTLLLDAFGKFARGFQGLQPKCKPCTNAQVKTYAASPEAIAKKREAQRRRRKANPTTPEYNRRYNIRRYGITVEDYGRLLTAQDGMCAICGGADPMTRSGTFHVDHCHTSGRVRGLLCSRCNPALGAFQDSVDILEAAITYLRSA